ncbi:MAG: hypothetical protein NTX28_00105, partial [Novosphingobium sp.]|nr:hypothetical protein [Novosphingobium sp.]
FGHSSALFFAMDKAARSRFKKQKGAKKRDKGRETPRSTSSDKASRHRSSGHRLKRESARKNIALATRF